MTLSCPSSPFFMLATEKERRPVPTAEISLQGAEGGRNDRPEGSSSPRSERPASIYSLSVLQLE